MEGLLSIFCFDAWKPYQTFVFPCLIADQEPKDIVYILSFSHFMHLTFEDGTLIICLIGYNCNNVIFLRDTFFISYRIGALFTRENGMECISDWWVLV